MYALKKELEVPSLTQSLERLLKRIIDYNGSEYVAPKEFNNFLRAFGPLKQCLNNVHLAECNFHRSRLVPLLLPFLHFCSLIFM